MEDTNQLIQQAQADGLVIYDNRNLNYECKLCNKRMTGEVPLVQHLKNKKHVENGVRFAISHLRIAPQSLVKLLPPAVKAAAEEGVIEEAELPGGVSGITCRVCDKPLTGLAPIAQHLLGSEHNKQLGARQLMASVRNNGASGNNTNQAWCTPRPTPSPRSGSMVGPTGNPVFQAWNTMRSDTSLSHEVPTVANGNNLCYTSNGSNSSCPRIPPEPSGDSVHHSWNGTMPVKLPCPGNPAEPASTSKAVPQGQLFTAPPISSILKRPGETEFRTPAGDRQTLPSIGQRTMNLASDSTNSLVQQAVKDRVLTYDSDTMRYKCQVCCVPVSGNSGQAYLHLKHKTHREEGARCIIRQSGNGPQSLLDLLPQSAIEAAMAGTIIVTESNTFQCLTCDKFSTGLIPLKQHLEGADHLKRAGTTSQLPPIPQRMNNIQYPDIVPQPSFNYPSESQPRTTMYSDDSIDVLAEAFEKGVAVSTDNGAPDLYNCTTCNISLNGSKNLGQHLKGIKHIKVLQQKNRDKAAAATTRPSPPKDAEDLNNPTAVTNSIPRAEQPYSVTSEPRGHVHIFNYIFTGRTKKPTEREGAKMDTERIMITFTNMGYEVFAHENQTGQETEDTLEQMTQNEKLKTVDVLVMFFLSHGSDPYQFYANDLTIIDLHDVHYKFTDEKCPSMKKKPKIIFANFCRGPDMEKTEYDAMKDIPRDIVTIYATTEGISAPRNKTHGTHFVRSLCEILEEHAKDYELRAIYLQLDAVCKSRGGRQPKWEDDRFRDFYFNPKIF